MSLAFIVFTFFVEVFSIVLVNSCNCPSFCTCEKSTDLSALVVHSLWGFLSLVFLNKSFLISRKSLENVCDPSKCAVGDGVVSLFIKLF